MARGQRNTLRVHFRHVLDFSRFRESHHALVWPGVSYEDNVVGRVGVSTRNKKQCTTAVGGNIA